MNIVLERFSIGVYLDDFHSRRKNPVHGDRRFADPERVANQTEQLEAALARARAAGLNLVADRANRHWRNGNPGRARRLLKEYGFFTPKTPSRSD